MKILEIHNPKTTSGTLIPVHKIYTFKREARLSDEQDRQHTVHWARFNASKDDVWFYRHKPYKCDAVMWLVCRSVHQGEKAITPLLVRDN